MTKEQREKLDAMRDELGDLLDADEGIGDKLPPKNQVFCMRFSEVGQLLRAGKGRLFQPGDEIWNQSPLFAEPFRWIVIGRDVDGENTLTVWCPQGMGELCWRASARRRNTSARSKRLPSRRTRTAARPLKLRTASGP